MILNINSMICNNTKLHELWVRLELVDESGVGVALIPKLRIGELGFRTLTLI
jgi:hypothetical protein